RRRGTESSATTKGSSVVPGLAKQTSMPALTAVASSASAPFMWRSRQTITHHRPADPQQFRYLLHRVRANPAKLLICRSPPDLSPDLQVFHSRERASPRVLPGTSCCRASRDQGPWLGGPTLLRASFWELRRSSLPRASRRAG